MKSQLLILVVCCSLFQLANAQVLPQGMKYQAVARDLSGEILSNREITLKISLHSAIPDVKSDYSEMHHVVTNKLGLFALTVGEGRTISGDFDKIPWSSTDIYMAVSIQDDGSERFTVISDSRLLAVPYAFHAETASDLSDDENSGRGPGDGVQSKRWALTGNYGSDPAQHKLGTTDEVDLIMVTNNLEQVRITSKGVVNIVNTVNAGSHLNVDGDLTVKNNSSTALSGTLDVGKSLNVDGATRLNDSVTVTNLAPTHLTGTLDIDKSLNVDGPTILNDSLVVANGARTHLTGDLTVDGKVSFGKEIQVAGALNLHDSLTVHDMAPVRFTGTQDVDGAFTANGKTTLNDSVLINDRLDVVHQDQGFVATFENSNPGNGDGIKIKLGKTHPRWMNNPPVPFSNEISAQIPGFTFLDAAVTSTKNLIKGLMVSPSNTFNAENFEQIGLDMLDAFESEMGASLETYASLACNTTKDIIDDINSDLNLPWSFPSLSTPSIHVSNAVTVTPGIDFPSPLPDVPSVTVPAINVPSAHIIGSFQVFPMIPSPSCPQPPDLSDWDLPNFRLSDVPNSLTHENQYLQFTDKDDRQLGTVRAESIDDWCDRYLSLTYFLNIFNSFAGVTVIGLDPTQIAETAVKYAINGLAQVASLADEYNSIGVEYSSGFGDYAEWLERAEPSEQILPGDIVGVVGGKISRDLTNAEQVMAVSSNPIVLGNTPPADKAEMGNKVAFMGQIPVKVMGAVKTGDYIVGQSEIPGYGVAIHPEDMTVDDFRLTVGRSWESMEGDGPKLVNTVVGVHNGNSLNILKKYQKRLDETDARLNSLESRLDMYFTTPTNND